MAQRNSSPFGLNAIVGILFFVGFLILSYYVLKWLFIALMVLAPVMLIGAFVIDKDTVINYGKWLARNIKTRPTYGIGMLLFSLLGFMVVCPFLLLKAIFKKKMKEVAGQFQQQTGGQRQERQTEEFTEYEEVTDEPEEKLELPPIEKQPQKQTRGNDYEQLFD